LSDLEAVIEVESLTRVFGTTVALDDISLTAPAGRVLGLLGPNGAGKTTLVRILATLLAPSAGSARVLGYDVVGSAGKLRGVIGLTGQIATVDELLTGRENLVMIGELYHLSRSDSRRRAQELLEEFDLADAADRRSGTYSGGMRRRLDLAASLIGRPPVVFLDEPTTGLDPRSRFTLWAAINQLTEAGTTVLLTTQYLEEADQLSHNIAVIDHGRLIAEGTPDELKAQVGDERVEFHVIEPDQVDAAARVTAPVAGEGMRVVQDHRRVMLPAPDGVVTLRAVLGLLGDARIAVDDVALHRPSLDDVFLTLTGRGVTDGNGHSASSNDVSSTARNA
jgi:ABC-2 type transport system ATP-binding protein